MAIKQHGVEEKQTAKVQYGPEANNVEYARKLDSQNPSFRGQFTIPSVSDIRRKELRSNGVSMRLLLPDNKATLLTFSKDDSSDKSIYFCGNSLGLQPKAAREYVNAQLDTWSSIGVNGHFQQMEESPLKPWQHMAKFCADSSAPLVGALPSEVAICNTLTANLHFLMASFYKPSGKKSKIIMDWKAFPSDHYAIESQIQWHGYDPKENMILVSPDDDFTITTQKVLDIIDANAEETALLLLPGIQYYSGQYFDIATITAHAHSKGLVVGWDLAHAAGNVPVRLHDWNVDFACWCTYKYINGGPGSIAGLFVHERHGKIDFESSGDGTPRFTHRLTGWYGHEVSTRFRMDNKFIPTEGAGGWQMSNPSAIDLASLAGSLSVFNQTSIQDLRAKSLKLTAYAEFLLDEVVTSLSSDESPLFRIITPRDPEQRGAQLCVLLLRSGLLDVVMKTLGDAGIIVDKRQPDVVRIAPVPLYNTFEEVFRFVEKFREALVQGTS